MEKLKLPKFHWAKLISIFFFVILLGSYIKIFAIASPYSPGEILDPLCAPGEENCIVEISGGGTPAGPNGGIQFNNNGTFDGSTGFTWIGGSSGNPFSIGADVTFTKADYEVVGTVPETPTDDISQFVHLKRDDTQALYNAVSETSYDRNNGTSPAGTEWNALGWSDLSDIESRVYSSLNGAVGGQIGRNIIGSELVMHDIGADKYYKFEFTSWSSADNGGRGGFSYTRSLINTSDFSVGSGFTFNRPDSTFDLPGPPSDDISSSVQLTRGESGGLYNVVSETYKDYNSTSPAGTEWNSQDWGDLTNVDTRTYTSFSDALGGQNNLRDNILNYELVMHDIAEDTYYKFSFSAWTSGNGGGGGGFSYTRNLINLPTPISNKLTASANVLIEGSNRYLNFGPYSGSGGYGIRDNGGVIEYKNSGEGWTGIGGGGLSSDAYNNTFGGTDAGANLNLDEAPNNTGIGYRALYSNTSGSNNTANGSQSLYSNTTGSDNTANGVSSLFSNTTGYNNTANGSQSLYSNTTGSGNTANGVSSLFSNTEGSSNTANGYQSLYSNTSGGNNTANGYGSLFSNTIGSSNTANGFYSLFSNTTGYENTANGLDSLYFNTTGYANTANGLDSLYFNTYGSENTANGFYSLFLNTSGSQNTALGYKSGSYAGSGTTANANSSNSLYLGYNTRASANGNTNEIVMGYETVGHGSNTTTIGNTSNLRTYLTGLNLKAGSAIAGTAPLKFTSGTNLGTTEAGAVEYDGSHLYFTATNSGPRYQLDQQGGGLTSDADYNTKGGTDAGLNLVAGAQYNTFLGFEAGKSGAGTTNAADYNTAIGYQSLYSNTLGYNNTANGYQSLYSNTSGGNNTANGYGSLFSNTIGSQNTANGIFSLYFNTIGNDNTANGYQSLVYNTIGNANTTNGMNSLYSNTTGTYNIGLGYEAGRYISGSTPNTTGDYNIFLGPNTQALADDDQNEIVIGYNTTGNGSNTTTIGNSSTIQTYLTGLNLKAGTATAGTVPLKFTSGTVLGTTEAGAVEYDGSHLYFTATNAGTRYQLDQQGGGGLSSDADLNTKGGTSAGLNLVAGAQYNTFLGYEAGKSGAVGGTNIADYNTAIGYQSLFSNTTGFKNTANGYQSLYSNTTGFENTANGMQSLYSNTTGTQNTANGYYSLSSNTTGSANTANGFQSLFSNTTGTLNTANGYASLDSNTTGTYNTGLGYQAGHYISGSTPNTTGDYNIFIGSNTKALADDDQNEIVVGYNTTGNGTNTATIGNTSTLRTYLTGLNLKAGTATAGTAPLKFTSGTVLGTTEAGAVEYDGTHLYFTAVNSGPRYQLDQQSGGGGLSSDADFNTKGGTDAGLNLVSGAQYNTFLGYEAGKGGVVTIAADNNTAIGYRSLYSNTTGYSNTASGMNSLNSNTTGFYNTANGNRSLYSNTAGSYNIANGNRSLYSNTTGSENTANGSYSLDSNTTGSQNTANGNYSLYSNTTGTYNIGLGYEAGRYISGGATANTTGDYNIFLGYKTKALADNDQNEIVIGYDTTGNGSNTATIGNTSTLRTYLTGLNLKAGSATAGTAPLKFTSSAGTLLGTTEAGAVEFDGSHLYFTAIDGGDRYQLDQQGGGGGLMSDANYNTFGGTDAGVNVTLGGATENTGIGYQALYSNTTGSGNTANGSFSLYFNTTGSGNTANGSYSLNSNNEGYANTANGSFSLYSNTTGTFNTGLGYEAGRYISGGALNTTGDYNIFIGSDTKALADDDENEIVIGYDTTGNGSNTATIGNTSTLRTYLTGLNLTAGTATAGTAPLKFTSGTNLSTTEAGAVEYDGTHLYFTATSSGPRYQLDQQAGGGSMVYPAVGIAVSTGSAWGTSIVDNSTNWNNALPSSSFTDAGVTGKLLTGYVSGSGVVADTDTILQGIQKLNGNVDNKVSSQWTTTGSDIYYNTGRAFIGATSEGVSSSKLYLAGTTSGNGVTSAIAGILGGYTFNPSAGGVQVGNRFVVTNSPTSVANTSVGEIIRTVDNTSLANLVRGLEVASNAGSNTAGVNTGIRTTGGTFGLQAITTGLSGGDLTPAALYGESTGTTQGDVLRLYSNTMTSATSFATFYHNTSAFAGTGLLMDFAEGSGTFSGNFVDFQKNNNSLFKVTNGGVLTMGLSATAATSAVCSSLANGTAPTADVAYEIRDCSNTPVADYAEMYPVESDVSYGDIVAIKEAIPENMVNTYDVDANGVIDWNNVKSSITRLEKSSKSYQGNVIGVVSNNYSDFSSVGYNIKDEDNPMPIAMNGRVPVKIASTSESIKAGDYLTTSSLENGKAMKALSSGFVIGKALEDWDKDGGKETIMFFVEQGYHDNTIELDGLTYLNANKEFIESIKFNDVVEFVLPPLFNNDTAGFAIIKAETNKVDVVFDTPYISQPIISSTISFEDTLGSNMTDEEAQKFFDEGIQTIVTNKTQYGFTIRINKNATNDILFSWIALQVRDPKIFESVVDGLVIEQDEIVVPEVSTENSDGDTTADESAIGENILDDTANIPGGDTLEIIKITDEKEVIDEPKIEESTEVLKDEPEAESDPITTSVIESTSTSETSQ